ncbi:MAG TPA: GntR family transcriptional regulator [Sedimentisphaerales bacterium]|nr:GntR family transcriptional regulator [Sedimentisphaerales bacterium]
MVIDVTSQQPLYRQLYRILKDDIESGVYPPAKQLPPEPELCKKYNVSITTIRQAVSLLVAEKVVYRRQGKGTFVAEQGDSFQFKAVKNIGFLANFPNEKQDARYEILPEIIHVMESAAIRYGYNLSVFNIKPDSAESRLELISRGNVDGVVFWPLAESAGEHLNRQVMTSLLGLHVPVVLFDRFIPGYDVDHVVSDNQQGAFSLVHHLIELGHRRIAVIADSKNTTVEDRITGYKKALAVAGIDFDPDLVKIGTQEASVQQVAEHVKLLLSLSEPPTALFGIYDNLAMAAIRALKVQGLNVPDDIAVVGYDNRMFAEAISLTTVDQHFDQMAYKAIERLREKIEKKDKVVRRIVVTSKMIVRNSSTQLCRA